MVGIDTGTNLVYSLDRESAGFSGSAKAGMRFIGILDEDVSAGDSPITVWTQGVFRLRLASSSAMTGSAIVGKPVWTCNSGGGEIVDVTGVTGDFPIGNIVGWDGTAEPSGDYIDVRINPGAYRWGVYGVQTATAGMYFGAVWPPLM
jgi:hypothetical protein